MHRQFAALLDDATGVSEFVVVVNIDVRGFSAFSMTVESSEAALFIKKVYRKLLMDYFSGAAFFKPTGDGLLIVLPHSEGNVKEVVTDTVVKCVRVSQEFKSFLVDDLVINFKVPQAVGIGLARGAACRVMSGEHVLDYSGRVLNLASRLMDYARPGGVVFDGSLGVNLLPSEVRELFAEDRVFVKGIAEREPIIVYYTKEFTSLPLVSKHRMERPTWRTVERVWSVREWKEVTEWYGVDLPSEPIDANAIEVKVSFKKPSKRVSLTTNVPFLDFQYTLAGGSPRVRVNVAKMREALRKYHLRGAHVVKLAVLYPER